MKKLLYRSPFRPSSTATRHGVGIVRYAHPHRTRSPSRLEHTSDDRTPGRRHYPLIYKYPASCSPRPRTSIKGQYHLRRLLLQRLGACTHPQSLTLTEHCAQSPPLPRSRDADSAETLQHVQAYMPTTAQVRYGYPIPSSPDHLPLPDASSVPSSLQPTLACPSLGLDRARYLYSDLSASALDV